MSRKTNISYYSNKLPTIRYKWKKDSCNKGNNVFKGERSVCLFRLIDVVDKNVIASFEFSYNFEGIPVCLCQHKCGKTINYVQWEWSFLNSKERYENFPIAFTTNVLAFAMMLDNNLPKGSVSRGSVRKLQRQLNEFISTKQ